MSEVLLIIIQKNYMKDELKRSDMKKMADALMNEFGAELHNRGLQYPFVCEVV